MSREINLLTLIMFYGRFEERGGRIIELQVKRASLWKSESELFASEENHNS
jgi:hypothetical protein